MQLMNSVSLNEKTARSLLDIPSSKSLPSHVYNSPEIYELELDRVFYRKWLCVCHESELPNPGDAIVQEVGNRSVIILRTDGDDLRAFYNVCAHKGTRLLVDSGHYNTLQCRYHGWTYQLDGKLIGCPDFAGFDDLRKEDYSLFPIRIERWGGFVWINLNPKAEDLQSYLGDFCQKFTKYRLEELQWIKKIAVYDISANWKVVMENAMECYHCPLVHPETLGPVYRNLIPATEGEINGAYTLLHWTESSHAITRFRSHSKQLEAGSKLGFDEDEYHRKELPSVFPNNFFTLSPDNVATFFVWPKGPKRSIAVLQLYVRKWAVSDDYTELIRYFDLVNGQDAKICELAQQGLDCEIFEGGKLNKMEDTVQRFQHMYLEAMT